MIAILKVKSLTDRFNGWGFPIIECSSSAPIEVINNGYNDFSPVTEIDETHLIGIGSMFNGYHTAHLEITTPTGRTNCWFDLGVRQGKTNLIF